MATALINAFLDAKMKNAKTSVALYSVSSDVDGAKIVQQMGDGPPKRSSQMLTTACEPLDHRSATGCLHAPGDDGRG